MNIESGKISQRKDIFKRLSFGGLKERKKAYIILNIALPNAINKERA